MGDIIKNEKMTFPEKANKYRVEIILACSTTFLMAGIEMQRRGPQLVEKFSHVFNHSPGARAFLFSASHAPIPQLVFFFILPVLTLLLLREPLSKYGLRAGDWKKGLLYSFACVGALAPFLYWASTMPSFQRYYTRSLSIGFWWMVLQYGLYMFSWEFLLRGYLYFSLEERTGLLAIWIQSIPFAVSHLGKPAPEALTCYFGGLVLGYISMKTRSSLYAFLVHWGIYVTLLFFVMLQIK